MARKDIKLIFDTCAMLTKQAEAQAEKGEDIDTAILDGLQTNFQDILEFEKMYLISVQNRLYGNLLMELDFEIDFNQRGLTDLKVDRSPMALTINPLFCGEMKFAEFTGAIISELVKMVYLHPTEFGKLNASNDPKAHEDLEKASDAASNSVVQNDIRLDMNSTDRNAKNGCRLPQDAYTTATLNKDCKVQAKGDMDISYYYKILQKFKDKSNTGPDGDGPSPRGGGGNQNKTATKNNSNGKPTHQWEKVDSQEAEEQIKSLVSEAYNSLSERERGEIAGSVVGQQIKALLAPPEISWKDVLRKMVGSVPVPHRNTRRKLNRRQPERMDLPGRLPKRTVNVVVAFDTSGSMSDDDLRYCMNEVFNIVKVYEGYKITVIECDAAIQRVYTARNMGDMKLDMRGRGGTSFIPVIEYINGEGEYKNNPKYPGAGQFKDALLIYFTDGYGDNDIPRPRTYRNLWVVLEDEKCLSLSNPYGEVKALKKDSDWKKMKGR